MNTIDLTESAPPRFNVLIECGQCEKRIRMDEALDFHEETREAFECDGCGAVLIVRLKASLDFQITSTVSEVEPCYVPGGKRCTHDLHCKTCSIGMAKDSNNVKPNKWGGNPRCGCCRGMLV